MKKTNLFLSILARSVLLTGFLFAGASKENKQSLKTEAASGADYYFAGELTNWATNEIAFSNYEITVNVTGTSDDSFKFKENSGNNWDGSIGWDVLDYTKGWNLYCEDDRGNIRIKTPGSYTIYYDKTIDSYTNKGQAFWITKSSNTTYYYYSDDMKYGDSPRAYLYSSTSDKNNGWNNTPKMMWESGRLFSIRVETDFDRLIIQDNDRSNQSSNLELNPSYPYYWSSRLEWASIEPTFQYAIVHDGVESEKSVLSINENSTTANVKTEYFADFAAVAGDEMRFYANNTLISNSSSFGADDIAGNNVGVDDSAFIIQTSCSPSTVFFKVYDGAYSLWVSGYQNISFTGDAKVYVDEINKSSSFTLNVKDNNNTASAEPAELEYSNNGVIKVTYTKLTDGGKITYTSLKPGTATITASNGNSSAVKTIVVLSERDDLVNFKKLGLSSSDNKYGITFTDTMISDRYSAPSYTGTIDYDTESSVRLCQSNKSYIVGKSYTGKCYKISYKVKTASTNSREMLYYDASDVLNFSFENRPASSYKNKDLIKEAKEYSYEFENPTSSPAILIEGTIGYIENLVFYWTYNDNYGLAETETLPNRFDFVFAGTHKTDNRFAYTDASHFDSSGNCFRTINATKDNNNRLNISNAYYLTAIRYEDNEFYIYDHYSNKYLSLKAEDSNDLILTSDSTNALWTFNNTSNGITVNFSSSGSKFLAFYTNKNSDSLKNYGGTHNPAYVYFCNNDILHDFYKDNLKFDSILSSNKNSDGNCINLGYYSSAKAAFNSFGLFIKSSVCNDILNSDALERLNAWANANGDKISDGELVAKSSANIFGFNNTEAIINDQTAPIVIIATSSTAVLGLGYLYLKKKKQDN